MRTMGHHTAAVHGVVYMDYFLESVSVSCDKYKLS